MFMNIGKSPGLDGIPPEMYLTFWSETGATILEIFHIAIKEGSFHRDINTPITNKRTIQGKDLDSCSS